MDSHITATTLRTSGGGAIAQRKLTILLDPGLLRLIYARPQELLHVVIDYIMIPPINFKRQLDRIRILSTYVSHYDENCIDLVVCTKAAKL
jgi:hypothetical protein